MGFCPVGFCLVGFCPVGFCPVGFCPGFVQCGMVVLFIVLGLLCFCFVVLISRRSPSIIISHTFAKFHSFLQ